MKVCTKCGIEKDESEFGKRKDSKDGLRDECNLCRKEYYKRYNKSRNIQLKEKREKKHIEVRPVCVICDNLIPFEFYDKRGPKTNCCSDECRKKRVHNLNKNWRDKNKEYCSIKNKEKWARNREKYLIKKREYYKNNSQIICEKQREYEKENKIILAEKNKIRRDRNKQKKSEYDKIYRANNSDKIKDKQKEYYKKNKDSILKKANEYAKRRRNDDINIKIMGNLRNRIFCAISQRYGVVKSKRTIELLGCEIDYLRSYLESQFGNGMTWENKKHWHIDHIIPCSVYDLTNAKDQEKCFNYKNLRPCWASENIRKSDKLDFDLIEKHNIWHLLPDRIKQKTV